MMLDDNDEISRLIEQPRESLAVEIKNWIDLNTPEGKAKIIKAVIAMRNFNGGYIIIGFDDEKCEAMPKPFNYSIEPFHADKFQLLISNHLSGELFEVQVKFPKKNGVEYPVIIIPGGVKSIVASKKELKSKGGKILIKKHAVFVRSLNSSHIPSTTEPKCEDWPDMVQRCFDNKEADIGNFLRRHLNNESIKELIDKLPTSKLEKKEKTKEFFNKARGRFDKVIKEKKLTIPNHGFWEAAMIINGKIPLYKTNEKFLQLLDTSHPRYTGCSIWQNFGESRYFKNKTWEAMLVKLNGYCDDHLDFMILDPTGQFYIRCALEDDIGGSDKQPEPLTELDFVLAILRTAETIAVGIAFAKVMGCNPETTSLSFLFGWNKLKGRKLSSWADRRRYISGRRIAHQNEVRSTIEVPLNTPLSRLGEYEKKLIDPLFEVFDGYEISQDIVDDLTNRLINRKL